jgi:hypothetical protein
METKIALKGKLAYENLLIKQYRVEIRKFLREEGIYTAGEIEQISRYYDKKIDTNNIIKVHTHTPVVFLTALCTGNLESIYNSTTSKHYPTKNQEV